MKFNTPQIATPISHQFKNEVVAREIIAVSDCLEVRHRSLESKWSNQVIFHIDIDLPHKWGERIKDYLQNAFNKKPELSLISLQASRCCEGENIVNGMFLLDGKQYSRQEMLENSNINTKWLRSILEKHIQIGLENNNYYPTPAYDIVTDSDFINSIINENDIHLVLDIAHAMVTAHNKKVSYHDYLESLTLDKLIQLHICQPLTPDNGVAYDAHEEPNDEMFDKVFSLIERYPTIKYLTIEYYKDKNIRA